MEYTSHQEKETQESEKVLAMNMLLEYGGILYYKMQKA